MVIVGATLVVAHCLIGGAAFAQLQDDGQPCPPECVTDTLEIETYYPSPYGYYEELRGDKIIVGDTDNSRIDETHLPPSGTLTFEPKSYAEITNTGTSYEGAIYYDSFDREFKYYDKNSSWQPLVGGGDYWNLSGNNIDIYFPSGNVGIGTATAQAKLTIADGELAVLGNQKGIILKEYNGSNCRRILVDSAGLFSVSGPISCNSIYTPTYTLIYVTTCDSGGVNAGGEVDSAPIGNMYINDSTCGGYAGKKTVHYGQAPPSSCGQCKSWAYLSCVLNFNSCAISGYRSNTGFSCTETGFYTTPGTSGC